MNLVLDPNKSELPRAATAVVKTFRGD